jgi:hypothetical protein
LSTELYLVTFPRSGHHLVESLIRATCRLNGIEYSYCEFYNCCQQSPCRDGKLLQGTHDFDLRLDPGDRRVFVLYRQDPVLQMDAWYRWHMGKKRGEYNHILETEADWWVGDEYVRGLRHYLLLRRDYYQGFVRKWSQSESELVDALDYHELVRQPSQGIKKVLMHLFAGSASTFQDDTLPDLDHVRRRNTMPEALHRQMLEYWNNINL